MATYLHEDGSKIETNGTICKHTTPNGGGMTWDVSKWNRSAEVWVDNDIKSGVYEGFVKVGA